MEAFIDTCTTSSSVSDNFQFVQFCFAIIKMEPQKVDFTDEAFLHKKIIKKSVYVDYGTADRYTINKSVNQSIYF